MLSIPNLPKHYKPPFVGKLISKKVCSQFDRFYKDEISRTKPDQFGSDRSKLRFYRTFKGSFTREPYLDLVKNRNQRSWLSRIRVSAHHLQIEVGRWKNPPVPPSERFCRYCSTESIDTEDHFLHDCETFSIKRNCFFAMLNSVVPGFQEMSIICPTNTKAAKLVNKYIDILFKARNQIDEGTPVQNIVDSFANYSNANI